jgi:hypothetical protein
MVGIGRCRDNRSFVIRVRQHYLNEFTVDRRIDGAKRFMSGDDALDRAPEGADRKASRYRNNTSYGHASPTKHVVDRPNRPLTLAKRTCAGHLYHDNALLLKGGVHSSAAVLSIDLSRVDGKTFVLVVRRPGGGRWPS